MRLEHQESEKDARHHRPPVEQQQTAAEQRRDPRAVLAARRVDENRRRRERQQQGAVERCQFQRTIERIPARDQPQAQCWNIGHQRQRRGQHQQHRRIAVVIKLDMRPGHRLLKDVKRGPVVNLGGAAVQRQPRARPVVHEIVAERATMAIRQAIAGLPQQVENVADDRDRDPATRDHAHAVRRDQFTPLRRLGVRLLRVDRRRWIDR